MFIKYIIILNIIIIIIYFLYEDLKPDKNKKNRLEISNLFSFYSNISTIN